MAKQRQSTENQANRRRPIVDGDWDEVDEASWESFPASDPPGWTFPDSYQRESSPTPPSIQESAAMPDKNKGRPDR